MAENANAVQQEATQSNKVTKIGTVVKASMDKTITVEATRLVRHKMYKKIIRRNKKYLVHDEHGAANVGDVVKIIECRPLSKRKNWRLLDIISKAK